MATTSVRKWTIRFHEYFPVQPGGAVRPPENTYVEFEATHAEAIGRFHAERATKTKSVQVTLYGSGPRVREARGDIGGTG